MGGWQRGEGGLQAPTSSDDVDTLVFIGQLADYSSSPKPVRCQGYSDYS